MFHATFIKQIEYKYRKGVTFFLKPHVVINLRGHEYRVMFLILQSSTTVQSTGDSITAVSRSEVLPKPEGSEVMLRVSAQVEKCAGGFGKLGSMAGALQVEQGEDESPSDQHNDRRSLIPGSVTDS